MMKKFKLLLALICAFTLCFTTSAVFAADDALSTSVTTTDNEVVYTLNLDGTPVTSGRVAVTYNENDLELVTYVSGLLFDVEDVNSNGKADSDGNKTIYFAFASADAVTEQKTSFTVTFKMKNVSDKDVYIYTTVEELYDGTNPVSLSSNEFSNLVEKTGSTTPQNPETPEDKPNLPNTGDNSHVMLFAIAACVSAGVIAAFVLSNKKKQNN